MTRVLGLLSCSFSTFASNFLEVSHYIPKPGKGERYAQSNDVFVDHRGLIYLIDRIQGMDILRFTEEKRTDR
jgi:hypothetical protein